MRNYLAILMSLVAVTLFAQDNNSGGGTKYVNEFLHIGVGASALGMGNVQVARSENVTAGYWNPAGLTGLQNNLEIGLMHAEYFAGIANYEYAGLGFKIDDQSAGGFTYLRFGVDDIPNTLNLVDANGNFDYDKITSFSATDNAFIFSYARLLGPENLSVGANVKVIYRKVGDFASAFGFGLDASAQHKIENIRLGVMFRDVFGTFNAWNYNTTDLEDVFARTGNELPSDGLEIAAPRMILGAGYEYEINEKFGIYPELNLETTFDGKRNTLIKTGLFSMDPRFGFEANYRKIVYLRAGIGNFQKETKDGGKEVMTFQPNIGVGIKLKKIAIDYALTDIGNASIAQYSNVFSLRIGINKRR